MTHEQQISELRAASAALAAEQKDTDRALNLRIAIKLAEEVRAVGRLPGNAPQCLGALVALLEEIERLNGVKRDNVRDLFRELECEGSITRGPIGRDPVADALAPKHPYPQYSPNTKVSREAQISHD